jgi:hypothetical protein
MQGLDRLPSLSNLARHGKKLPLVQIRELSVGEMSESFARESDGRFALLVVRHEMLIKRWFKRFILSSAAKDPADLAPSHFRGDPPMQLPNPPL